MFRRNRFLLTSSSLSTTANTKTTTAPARATTTPATATMKETAAFSSKSVALSKSLRKGVLPRRAALTPTPIIDFASMDTTQSKGIAQVHESCDMSNPHTGKLDHWRAVVQAQEEQFNWTCDDARLSPAWDAIVPLLARIEDAGRTPTVVNSGGWYHRAPDRVAVGRLIEDSHTGEKSTADLDTLPLGGRHTPEAVRRQFLVELNVRRPFLERSLFTTCTPVLLGKLLGAMAYCRVGVPAFADASAALGVADSDLRLRAMIVAALRHCDGAMQKRLTEDSVSELRRTRRLVLEAPAAGAIFEFVEANAATLRDVDAAKDASAAAVLNIDDASEECPALMRWAAAGNEYLLSGKRQSVFKLSQSPKAPERWLPGGAREKTDATEALIEE